jgi:FkbM family methyltransferase
MKHISLKTGTYRQARWLSRLLRPAELRAHQNDIRFYKSLLPPSVLCFDVGANIGEKSEAMLKAGAHVVAFEPSSEALPELRARCGKCKNWTLVNTAVGSKGSIVMLHATGDSGKSSLDSNWQNEADVVGRYRVPVVTLDAAIKEFGKPFYCKIDVEGWEPEVLRGLSQPIPLISFEFHLNEQGIARTRLCLERLLDFGTSYVNITPAELAFFHLSDWMSLEQFLKWFPDDLKQTLPGYPYGDIFIKNAYFS